jgi:nucleoside-diphosphate-sugar epimerase
MRLRELTGWEPGRTIEGAIDDTIAHQREQPGVVETVL